VKEPIAVAYYYEHILSLPWVTDLPLGPWHGTPSCMNMSSVCQKNLFCWPIHAAKVAGVFPVLFSTDLGLYCLWSVTKTLITLHTMTWIGMFLYLHADY